jgi:1-acyl-sn-glycerol-3-phosphate acyltransferase
MKASQISEVQFPEEDFSFEGQLRACGRYTPALRAGLDCPSIPAGGSPVAFLRKALRALCCVAIFLRGLPLFFWLRLSGKSNWRALWAQWISGKFLSLIGCKVCVSGAIPENGLIVSNHLSYLDILVISSASPAVFISKTEVRRWPVFGLLARMAGTVFVDRDRRTAVSDHLGSVASALEAELPVVLFPEGTSSDGSTVLPFRSSLLQAAIISHTAITPAAISYDLQGGRVADEICYWRDMIFAHHFWNLLGKQSLTATLRFGTPHAPGQGRKELAYTLRLAVLQLRGQHQELAAVS